MKDRYVIETGVPLPTKGNGGIRDRGFPFQQMLKGQSFYVPLTDDTPDSVRAAASRFTKLHPTFVFTSRRDKTGIRVWRQP